MQTNEEKRSKVLEVLKASFSRNKKPSNYESNNTLSKNIVFQENKVFVKFIYQLISKFNFTVVGHTRHKKNFPWMAHEIFWDLGQA